MSDRRPQAERDAADILVLHVLKVTSHDGCFCTCGDFSVARGDGARPAMAAHQAEALYDAGILAEVKG